MNLLSQNEADTLLDICRQVNNGLHDLAIYEALVVRGFIAKTLGGGWVCTVDGHEYLVALTGPLMP